MTAMTSKLLIVPTLEFHSDNNLFHAIFEWE